MDGKRNNPTVLNHTVCTPNKQPQTTTSQNVTEHANLFHLAQCSFNLEKPTPFTAMQLGKTHKINALLKPGRDKHKHVKRTKQTQFLLNGFTGVTMGKVSRSTSYLSAFVVIWDVFCWNRNTLSHLDLLYATKKKYCSTKLFSKLYFSENY